MENQINKSFCFQLYNVKFGIYLNTKSEETDFNNWLELLKENPERLRVSYVLTWLEGRGYYYMTKWSYCKKLNLYCNWKAFWGYRKQMKCLRYSRVNLNQIFKYKC